MISYVVSACLAGHSCRYDGRSNMCTTVHNLVMQGKALALCPEVLGGMPTPRTSSELCPPEKLCPAAHTQHNFHDMTLHSPLYARWRVMTKNGRDVSKEFILGAHKALDMAVKAGCTRAILKSRSPSCGVYDVYDGTFTKTLVSGRGVWATLLYEAGFTLFTEEDLPPPFEL